LCEVRRRIPIGEFDAGRQANALVHRHEHVSPIAVMQGMVEPGVAPDPVVHVVAALDRQWDVIAQRTKDIV